MVYSIRTIETQKKIQVKNLKRRIDQLLNEKFEYETPEMLFEEEKITGKVRKGENFRSFFTMENPTQKKMKGFLYSSSPRMGFEPAAFAGISAKIFYEADTAGMEEGDVLKGTFTICSSIGEYRLPYEIQVEQPKVKAMGESIDSLEAFAALAKKEFQRAYQLFVTPEFAQMLEKDAPQYLPLYQGLMAQSVSSRSLEEFLTAAGAKEAVNIETDKEKADFGLVTQSVQESIGLNKNTWGYFRLDVSSDAPFLWIERPIVTPEDFIGSSYQLRYLVDPARMHPGNNYGRILIQGDTWSTAIEITAKAPEYHAKDPGRKERKEQFAELEKAYVAFRLKKIDLNDWIIRSEKALAVCQGGRARDVMLSLFHIQLLFAAAKDEKASMELEMLEQHKERLSTPEIMGYYLYLTTFYHKDREYVDYVEERIRDLQRRQPEVWLFQWILLYLDEQLLRHPGEKLEAIRRQYQRGCRSRILYLEAAQVLERSPLLLRRLDAFDIQVLHFMCREDLINAELVMQLAELTGRAGNFGSVLYDVLCQCWEKYPGKGLTAAICSLLVKGHQSGIQYLKWFEKGVEEDIRLTGLYEYYIESLPEDWKKPLPQIIRIYFSYNNTLSHQKKASVYANVVRNKEADPHTYTSYVDGMEKFVLAQLSDGKFGRDMALLYQTFISDKMVEEQLLTKRMADNLVKAVFTAEVTCKEPGARTVIVRHKDLEKEQKVSLQDGRAYVQLYTKDYQIFIGDENGRRYAAAIPFETRMLMEDDRLLTLCRKLSPDTPGLVLYELEHFEKEETDGEKIRLYQKLPGLSGIQEKTKQSAREEVLAYYYAHPGEEASEYLKTVDLEPFVRTDKKKLIELLILNGMAKQAFSLAAAYGSEGIAPKLLVRMCSRMVLNLEFAEDEMLAAQCISCVKQGKYDENVLAYLLAYYDGPVDTMKLLWKAGKTFGLETFRLEEKIMLTVLFTRCSLSGTEEIFESYWKNIGKQHLLKAYGNLMSYEYFVRGKKTGRAVFAWLEKEAQSGELTETAGRLALLRHYSEMKKRTPLQEKIARELLEEYAQAGVKFPFFQNFGEDFLREFLLFDKSFLEYRTDPAAAVWLTYHYELENGEKSREYRESLNNVYEGIFVRSAALFEGERMVYTFREEKKGTVTETGEQVLLPGERKTGPENGAYGLLNRMSRAVLDQNLKEAQSLYKDYREQECIGKQIFTLM